MAEAQKLMLVSASTTWTNAYERVH